MKSRAMTQKSQIQKFREAARKIEADDSEERFDEALRRLAKSKRKPSQKTVKDEHED
jgi:hypothetical protein